MYIIVEFLPLLFVGCMSLMHLWLWKCCNPVRIFLSSWNGFLIFLMHYFHFVHLRLHAAILPLSSNSTSHHISRCGGTSLKAEFGARRHGVGWWRNTGAFGKTCDERDSWTLRNQSCDIAWLGFVFPQTWNHMSFFGCPVNSLRLWTFNKGLLDWPLPISAGLSCLNRHDAERFSWWNRKHELFASLVWSC